jgi:multiple sugar transport system ATP-binding protein
LRIVAGLERPDSGDIYFDGKKSNDVHPRERDVAMLFQNLALYPNKNGFENIATPLRIRNSPEKEVQRRVEEVATILHITHLLDRLPKTYSGGERQRVALGRAIIRRPKVYLLDEPLSNLDAVLRVEMRSELKRLQRDLNQTMIYVTHDQVEAMSMSDRIAVLHKGNIQQIDTPSKIFKNPLNSFTAGFFGSPPMSFIHSTVERENNKTFLICENLKLDVSRLGGRLKSYGSVIMGVRPQHVQMESHDTRETSKFKIEAIEPLGNKKVLTFLVNNDILLSIVPAVSEVKEGDFVVLRIDPSKVYMFDKDSNIVIS